jgi:hypothetical protein
MRENIQKGLTKEAAYGILKIRAASKRRRPEEAAGQKLPE